MAIKPKVKVTNETILLDGVENSVVEERLKTMLESNNIDAEFDDVKARFVKVTNSYFCKTKVDGVDKKLNYAVKTVKGQLEAGRMLPSKKTMPITCMLRNLGTIQKNYANVTQETKHFKDKEKDQKVGIAGSWRRCLNCNRQWDIADPKYGTNCPGCQSVSVTILAEQYAPKGTQGVLSKDMRMGDISIYNTLTSSIFLMQDGEVVEAFLKFTGDKQQELLNQIQFGVPFDINISAEEKDQFVNDTTGIQSFNCTGTSKVTEATNEMPDIMEIYENMYSDSDNSLIHSVANCADGTYPTLNLEVVKEAEQYKEGGKWVINLVEPTEKEDVEPIPVSMYLDEEHVAKQFELGDNGIFECRYTKQSRSAEGETKETGIINVPITLSGMAVYIMSENGTKLISV